MDLLLYILMFSASLFVLIKGSDWFVDSAEAIGLSFGISPFIIGVTIVAFGTSLPELAASIAAVLQGNSEIVVGNVVGSNVTNILLVLGVTAVVAREIVLDVDIMHVDMPLLVGSAFLMWLTLMDQHLSLFEQFLYLIALVLFLINSISQKSDDGMASKIGLRSYLFLLLGGVFVTFGAKYTIVAIEEIAGALDIGTEVIALTAVALGTSLPEVVVSITAARKGKTAIAVGNVLGSNIFNTYAVMAIPAFFGELKIPDEISEGTIPFMVIVTILFAFVCLSRKINRWEGAVLLLFYAFFLVQCFE